MKSLALKSVFLISVIAFIDYLVMITVGCMGSLFGFNNQFYECTFCTIGKVVLLVSIASIIAILYLDYKASFGQAKV